MCVPTRRGLLEGILNGKRHEPPFERPARHVDFRMLGILSELRRERGNDPITSFPIPSDESVARSGAITCQQAPPLDDRRNDGPAGTHLRRARRV